MTWNTFLMPKRSATEIVDPAVQNGRQYQKSVGTAVEEMGEFEDAWEDEIESDDGEVVDAEADEQEDGTSITNPIQKLLKYHQGMDVDEVLPPIEESEELPPAPQAFIPGTHVVGQDEVLEADDSVYIMRHTMNVNWPCLSFDILRDNLGDERQRYPAVAYLVTGSQADVPKNNEVSVYKLSSLHRTQKDGGKSEERRVVQDY